MAKGQCGVWSDYDLTMRMWLAGWQVGYFPFPRCATRVVLLALVVLLLLVAAKTLVAATAQLRLAAPGPRDVQQQGLPRLRARAAATACLYLPPAARARRGSDHVEEQGGTHRSAAIKSCWEKQVHLSSGLYRFRWAVRRTPSPPPQCCLFEHRCCCRRRRRAGRDGMPALPACLPAFCRFESAVDRYMVHDEVFAQVKRLNLNLTLRGDDGWCPYRWPALCEGLPYKAHPDAPQLAERGGDAWQPLSIPDALQRRRRRRRGLSSSSGSSSSRRLLRLGGGGGGRTGGQEH